MPSGAVAGDENVAFVCALEDIDKLPGDQLSISGHRTSALWLVNGDAHGRGLGITAGPGFRVSQQMHCPSVEFQRDQDSAYVGFGGTGVDATFVPEVEGAQFL